MSSRVTVRLMDAYLYGRDLQNAILAYIYGDASSGLRRAIRLSVNSNLLELGDHELKELASLIVDKVSRLCNEESRKQKPSSRLYRAGEGDSEILSEAGLKVSQQKKLELDCNTLIDYFKSIAEGTTGGDYILKPCSLPMLAKTYLFTRTRDSWNKLSKAQSFSIVLAIAGAYISLVAVHKTNEVYVVPDGSFISMETGPTVYTILLAEWLGSIRYYGLSDIIKGFMNLENSSPDISLMLAIASHALLYKHEIDASIEPGIFEGYKLVKINTGQRPQMMWSTPLLMVSRAITVDRDKKALAQVLKGVFNLTSSGNNAVREAAGVCLNSIHKYIETKDIGYLVDCSSNLSKLLLATNISKEDKNKVEYLLKKLGEHVLGSVVV